MQGEQPQMDATAQRDEGISGDGGRTGPRHLSRRQAIGHMSAVAAAGAVAWAVPEILTAKPAAGATLSNPVADGVSTSGSTATVGTNGPDGVATAAADTPTSLAFTGLNIQRDAEVGAALVAGGWAMQHWASRASKPVGTGPSEAHQVDGAG
jgi:hypothetical protein